MKHSKLPNDNTENTCNLFFFSLSEANQETLSSSLTSCVTGSIFYIKTDKQVNGCCADTVQTVIAICVETESEGMSSPYQLEPKEFQNCSDSFMSDGRKAQRCFIITNITLHMPVKELSSPSCLQVLSYRLLQPDGESHLGLREDLFWGQS